MAGPMIAGRAGQPLDLLEQGVAGDGWAGLEAMLVQPERRGELQPPDTVSTFMWGLYCTPEGRAMFEWMMDISIRQPLRITGKTFEETALLSASRQALNGMAEVILKAIAEGERQVSEKRNNQNGAG